MPKISEDKRLADLSLLDRKHWELHLNVALKDNPLLEKEIEVFLIGGELPNIKHPAYIHDWLEQPERRAEIEALNG